MDLLIKEERKLNIPSKNFVFFYNGHNAYSERTPERHEQFRLINFPLCQLALWAERHCDGL